MTGTSYSYVSCMYLNFPADNGWGITSGSAYKECGCSGDRCSSLTQNYHGCNTGAINGDIAY